VTGSRRPAAASTGSDIAGADEVGRVDQAEGGVDDQLAGLHRPGDGERLGRRAVLQGREHRMGVADGGSQPRGSWQVTALAGQSSALMLNTAARSRLPSQRLYGWARAQATLSSPQSAGRSAAKAR
jgi:hypothetical protein